MFTLHYSQLWYLHLKPKTVCENRSSLRDLLSFLLFHNCIIFPVGKTYICRRSLTRPCYPVNFSALLISTKGLSAQLCWAGVLKPQLSTLPPLGGSWATKDTQDSLPPVRSLTQPCRARVSVSCVLFSVPKNGSQFSLSILFFRLKKKKSQVHTKGKWKVYRC